MRLRVKNKWQDKNRERSIEDTAGVVAFNLWKIASANVLNLENEGFQTDTQSQRIDVIEELGEGHDTVSVDVTSSTKPVEHEVREDTMAAPTLVFEAELVGVGSRHHEPVSYTHLTLPTKIV